MNSKTAYSIIPLLTLLLVLCRCPSSVCPVAIYMRKRNLRWHLQICPFISPNRLICLKTLAKTPFSLRNDSPPYCPTNSNNYVTRLLAVGDYGVICANPLFTWYQMLCQRTETSSLNLSAWSSPFIKMAEGGEEGEDDIDSNKTDKQWWHWLC